jgi:hypothetical protein
MMQYFGVGFSAKRIACAIDGDKSMETVDKVVAEESSVKHPDMHGMVPSRWLPVQGSADASKGFETTVESSELDGWVHQRNSAHCDRYTQSLTCSSLSTNCQRAAGQMAARVPGLGGPQLAASAHGHGAGPTPHAAPRDPQCGAYHAAGVIGIIGADGRDPAQTAARPARA